MSQHAERWSPPARDPDDDSPRLECGVFGVYDTAEASGITALGPKQDSPGALAFTGFTRLADAIQRIHDGDWDTR